MNDLQLESVIGKSWEKMPHLFACLLKNGLKSISDDLKFLKIIWFLLLKFAQRSLDKIKNTFNETLLVGWKSIHQGLRIYFV